MYVAQEAAKVLGKPLEELKMITAHIGNGASITAIEGGKSVDTSMGFTPLAGVNDGNTCGGNGCFSHSLYVGERSES